VSAKAIDSLLSNVKSGLGIDKALEELKNINARSKDKQFSFNEIFTFDAALGRYVYTVNGLNTALA